MGAVPLYVGEVGGVVAGWVYVRCLLLLEEDARAEVWGLVVDERFRRQRIGEALMRKAEQWARDAGYHEMRLRSSIARTGAHAFLSAHWLFNSEDVAHLLEGLG